MKLITRSLVGIGLMTALSVAQGAAADGDTPTYTFRDSLLNGRGVQSLEDLRGRPVLVEFWGTR